MKGIAASNFKPVHSAATGLFFKCMIAVFLFLAVSPNSNLFSQTVGLQYPTGNGSNIRFKQEFNTYIWNFNVNAFQIVHNRWQFKISENFRTSLLNTSSTVDKWKDDQTLDVGLNYLLSPQFTLNSRVNSVVFMDKQSGFTNDIRTHYGNIGLTYTPTNNIMASIAAGPKWDKRYEQNDQGYNYSIHTQAVDLDWEEYQNSLDFVLENEKYEKRQNYDVNLNYTAFREFSPGTRDSLNVFTNNQRRDNYTSFSGDIESLREQVRGINNTLSYKIGDHVNMTLNSGLYFKNVEILSFLNQNEEKRRKRNDQRISQDVYWHLNYPGLTNYLQFSYWTQNQSYDIELTNTNVPFSQRTAFVTPDNESSRIMMVGGLGKNITKKDSLYSYVSISKYQYDTPDTSNFDDRDELRINSRIIAFHNFNAILSMELQASLNLYHMVYIFGERSADNNWNRIFMLRPVFHVTPNNRFKLRQSFEVLANYVDYDFDDMYTQTKSFVFRKFSIDDSLQYRLSRRTLFQMDYRLQLEENGQLSWDDWTERVLVTRNKQWLHALYGYEPREYFTISSGYSYYIREEWRHNTTVEGVEEKEKFGVYTSQGPILRFQYAPSSRSRLILDAVRYKVNPPDQTEYYINNIELQLNWVF